MLYQANLAVRRFHIRTACSQGYFGVYVQYSYLSR